MDKDIISYLNSPVLQNQEIGIALAFQNKITPMEMAWHFLNSKYNWTIATGEMYKDIGLNIQIHYSYIEYMQSIQTIVVALNYKNIYTCINDGPLNSAFLEGLFEQEVVYPLAKAIQNSKL